jgi:hypothetical protein
VTEKQLRYWYARSKPDGKLEFEEITATVAASLESPDAREDLSGRPVHANIKLENEYYVFVVFSADAATHEIVKLTSRDAAAIAQEWMMPAQPPPEADDGAAR